MPEWVNLPVAEAVPRLVNLAGLTSDDTRLKSWGRPSPQRICPRTPPPTTLAAGRGLDRQRFPLRILSRTVPIGADGGKHRRWPYPCKAQRSPVTIARLSVMQ